jgi:nitrogen fixation/metabolism regulation signal transduction histidine kinase
MTYKTKFLIFLILLHLAEAVLAGIVLHSNKIWFIASEGIVLLSVIGSIYFYTAFTKPLQLIHSGIESIRDKDFSMRLVKVGQQELDNLIEVYNHMIDKLRKERTLHQEQHLFLELLLKATPSGIVILDPDDNIITINPAAEKFLGIKQEVAKNKSFGALNNSLAKELAKVESNDATIIQASGLEKYKIHKSYFVNQGFRNHFITIEELTDEIYLAERTAYEKVIRTISHEFNNSIGPINSILNSLKFYTGQLEASHQTDYTNAIDVAVERNNTLNGFVKRYAEVFKLPLPNKEICNIGELLQRVERIFHLELKNRNIHLEIESQDSAMIVKLDVNQFELVLSNILKNAVEAIHENGQISVCVQNYPASILIQNNGAPILPEIQKNLFSPFFTTKKTGQGIGLTLVREVLQNHNFKFSLQSISNGLTEFWIYF